MVFVLPGAIGLSKYVNIMDTSKEAQQRRPRETWRRTTCRIRNETLCI